jgi:hypothetical protein
MAARPDKLPGRFKVAGNRVYGHEFVHPALVEGTLREGIAMLPGIGHAFGRACFLHALTAEVHPFTDGNGRMSRMLANAELAGDGQARLIVPTLYRNDYISSLEALTGNRIFGPFPESVRWLQRFSASMPWEEDLAVVAVLQRVGAFDRSASGGKLRIPPATWVAEEIERVRASDRPNDRAASP